MKLLVGFPPGGSTDLAARALADKLSQALGQPVVVENKPGASGNIAAETVARSAPDGYALLMAATSFATAPAFFAKLGWDPVTDFSPVALVATVPIIAVVNPSLPVNTPQQLIDYSKANPGRLNLASPGATTLTRLSGEMFKQIAGLDWVTVHYRGGAPAVQDMLGGSGHVMFANISDVIGHVRAGDLAGDRGHDAEALGHRPGAADARRIGIPELFLLHMAGGGRAGGDAGSGRRAAQPGNRPGHGGAGDEGALSGDRHRCREQHARRARPVPRRGGEKDQAHRRVGRRHRQLAQRRGPAAIVAAGLTT